MFVYRVIESKIIQHKSKSRSHTFYVLKAWIFVGQYLFICLCISIKIDQEEYIDFFYRFKFNPKERRRREYDDDVAFSIFYFFIDFFCFEEHNNNFHDVLFLLRLFLALYL